MKKLVVLLLALMMVGAVAFAQTAPAAAAPAPAVQFSDSFSTGLMLNMPGSGTNTLSLYDYWDNGDALYNDFDVSYSAGNYGWFAEFDTADGSAQPTFTWDATSSGVNSTVTGSQPSFDALNGWIKFGTMAKLTTGWAWDTSFKTLGDVGYYSDFYGTGGFLDFYPVQGLTIGWYVPATSAGNNMDNSIGNSRFGVAYTMAKIFSFTGTYDLSQVANSAKATASVSVAAIENLTANAELFLTHIGDANAQETKLTQTVGYTVGNITPKVVAYEYLFSASGSAFGYNVKPELVYAMGNTTFTGYFKYFADNNYTATGASSPTVLTSATTHYEFGVYAKQVFDDHMTGWLGFVYGDKSTIDPALTSTSYFKVPLSIAYSF